MKYLASVSFGKDSLAMLLRLIEEKYPLDFVMFYDTGMEFDSIYNIKSQIKDTLYNLNIKYIESYPKNPFLYDMIERPVSSKTKGDHFGYGWCGGLCRWGTSEKIKAIKKFKESLNDQVIDYVGIASDEPKRFNKAKQEGKVLPLVEWNMTEKDCLEYCRERGYNWHEQGAYGEIDLYDILHRVSCWCCCNKNLRELRNIKKYLPEYWEKLKSLQKKIDRPFKGYYKGMPQGIFELEDKFNHENA